MNNRIGILQTTYRGPNKQKELIVARSTIKQNYHLIPHNHRIGIMFWGNDHNEGIIKLIRIHRGTQHAT